MQLWVLKRNIFPRKCIFKIHFLLVLIYFVAVFEPEQTMRTGGKIYGLFKTTGGLIGLEHADFINLDLYRLFRYVPFDGLTPSIFSGGTIFFYRIDICFLVQSKLHKGVFPFQSIERLF